MPGAKGSNSTFCTSIVLLVGRELFITTRCRARAYAVVASSAFTQIHSYMLKGYMWRNYTTIKRSVALHLITFLVHAPFLCKMEAFYERVEQRYEVKL